MIAAARNNVQISGVPGARPMVFAHGFGCDLHMWRRVAPAFEESHQVVLFDHVGAGGSDLAAYSPERYDSLDAYADDVLDLLRELDLRDAVFVGHSVSAMIGAIAAIEDPERIGSLVLVGPSPRYIDDVGYVGGFSREDIDGLLATMDANYLGWSSAMAPMIMGNAAEPAFGEELEQSFCRTDPDVARQFARVVFLSDNREDLARVEVPTLILQCTDDVIAPVEVGQFVHRQVRGSEIVLLDATGHCPHVSAPHETIDAIRAFV